MPKIFKVLACSLGYGVCGVGWLAWLWCLRCWLVSVVMVFAVLADYCVGWLSCLTYPQYNPLTPIFALPCIYIHGILHILTLLHAYLLSYILPASILQFTCLYITLFLSIFPFILFLFFYPLYFFLFPHIAQHSTTILSFIHLLSLSLSSTVLLLGSCIFYSAPAYSTRLPPPS